MRVSTWTWGRGAACTLTVLLACLLGGCVTPRDQTAIVRDVKHHQAAGEVERAQEMAEVALDVGALAQDAQGNLIPGDVDPATVEDTPEAAAENAKGIAADRKTRQAVVVLFRSFGQAFVDELAKRAPGGAAALSALGALWALWRKRSVQQAAVAAVGSLNDFKHLVERVKDALGKPDAETDWGALATDAGALLGKLKCAGTEGAAAWKELSAMHAALKAKGKAA